MPKKRERKVIRYTRQLFCWKECKSLPKKEKRFWIHSTTVRSGQIMLLKRKRKCTKKREILKSYWMHLATVVLKRKWKITKKKRGKSEKLLDALDDSEVGANYAVDPLHNWLDDVKNAEMFRTLKKMKWVMRIMLKIKNFLGGPRRNVAKFNDDGWTPFSECGNQNRHYDRVNNAEE